MSIRTELQKLREQNDGTLRPSVVVEFARTHPKSALHKRFDWDVKRAAMEHWLGQARDLIRVHIDIVDCGDAKKPVRTFVSFKSARAYESGERGYVETKTVLAKRETRRRLVEQQLKRMWSIYRSYPLPELESVAAAIRIVGKRYAVSGLSLDRSPKKQEMKRIA